MIEKIDQAQFDSLLADVSKPVAFVYTASWCAPCKALKQTLDKIPQTVYSVDVDDNPKAAQRFGVRGIPTMVFVKDGKQVDQLVGAVPRSQIDASLAKAGME